MAEATARTAGPSKWSNWFPILTLHPLSPLSPAKVCMAKSQPTAPIVTALSYFPV
jgi:hypothetical protein